MALTYLVWSSYRARYIGANIFSLELYLEQDTLALIYLVCSYT